MKTQYIQLHILTDHGPSCLNRDDDGRPKTAPYGGVMRTRISSQSEKRALRMSDVFREAVGGEPATRTRLLSDKIEEHLLSQSVAPEKAKSIAAEFKAVFEKKEKNGDADNGDDNGNGKPKKKAKEKERVLAFFSAAEHQAALNLAEKRARGEGDAVTATALFSNAASPDIAMYGRMVASDPSCNIEAAVSVSHAITTSAGMVEDDYFTGVDDLNSNGAGHVDVSYFSAGVYYTYVVVNLGLLVENLNGNVELAKRAVRGLVEALATVSPSGKRASFASYAYASYVLAERGNRQPRSLVSAFSKPIDGRDQIRASIAALEATRARMERIRKSEQPPAIVNVMAESGTLEEVIAYATEDW